MSCIPERPSNNKEEMIMIEFLEKDTHGAAAALFFMFKL